VYIVVLLCCFGVLNDIYGVYCTVDCAARRYMVVCDTLGWVQLVTTAAGWPAGRQNHAVSLSPQRGFQPNATHAANLRTYGI